MRFLPQDLFGSAVLCALLASPLVPRAAAAEVRFTDDGNNHLAFDTGVVQGSIQKDGAGEGIRPIKFPDAPPFGINHGLLVPYRFLTPQKRFGFGSWEWPRTGRVNADGSATLSWARTADRPFQFSVHYRWKDEGTLDAVIEFTSDTKLENFELLLGSYFSPSIFSQTRAHVRNAAQGRPGFIPVIGRNGVTQLFPTTPDVLPMVDDGRWKLPPNPMTWRFGGDTAGPLVMKQAPGTGAMVIVMSPPQDCFAVSMWHQDAKQGGVYFSMFGRDLAPGQKATAHVRLVFGRNLSDSEIERRYGAYLAEIKGSLDPAAGVRVAKPAATMAWISPAVPEPNAAGWITLFDGQRLSGAIADEKNVAAGKIFLNEGALGLDGTKVQFDLNARNAALRVRGKKISARNITLSIGPYRGWFNGKFVCFGIHKVEGEKIVTELGSKKAPAFTDFFDLEMSVVDGKITLKANGQNVLSAQSDPITNEVPLFVWAVDGLGLIKLIEVKRL